MTEFSKNRLNLWFKRNRISKRTESPLNFLVKNQEKTQRVFKKFKQIKSIENGFGVQCTFREGVRPSECPLTRG